MMNATLGTAVERAASVRRCVDRAEALMGDCGTGFQTDLCRQDAASVNIMRACETCFQMATAFLSKNGFGMHEEGDAFSVLGRAGIISGNLAEALQKISGYPDIAMRADITTNLTALTEIASLHLPDFTLFVDAILVAERDFPLTQTPAMPAPPAPPP